MCRVAPVLYLALVALLAPCSRAWGPDGHEITASIASKYVTSYTAAAIKSILPEGQDMNAVSTWADSVKRLPQWEWSSQLHYVNPPADKCDFNMTRDCDNDMCVVGAIVNFTTQLNTSSVAQVPLHRLERATQMFAGVHNKLPGSRTQRFGYEPIGHLDALKFLIHFCGDVHQPLHCSGKKKGGNLEYVYFFGESSELHRVWDSDMIIRRMGELGGKQEDLTNEILASLNNGTFGPKIAGWKTCYHNEETYCPGDWAYESAELACNHAFKDVYYKEDLTEPYYKYNLPIVEERLAQGGVRLAHILNLLFDSSYRAEEQVRARSARVIARKQ